MAVSVAFTLGEAAEVLDPPMTEKQLRAIIKSLGWKPAGMRYTGRSGHPVATWDMARIQRLHIALLPFMDAPAATAAGDGVT
jgi:hypothetical protein